MVCRWMGGETAETDKLMTLVRDRRPGMEEEEPLEVSDEADPMVVI